MRARLTVGLALIISLWLVPAPATAASILLGTGTLTTPNDLTVIQTDAGVLQFLDLSATNRWSVSAAVAAYSPAGFRWADGGEVAALLEAFNISYAVAHGGAQYITPTDAAQASFLNYLGVTHYSGNATLGWVDDLTGGGYYTYVCIGPRCGGGGFTENTNVYSPPSIDVGVFLVRDATAVPEPASLLLLGTGLAGAALVRRRRR